MYALLGFIIVFSLVVIIHEGGHFLAAKKVGMVVHEFAVGMGPVLISKMHKGTKFSIRAIPLGGFVRIEGEEKDSADSNAFAKKTPLQRIFVLVAGSASNIIVALIIYTIIGFFVAFPTTTIDSVMPDSPAEAAGIVLGDEITSINGETVWNWNQITAKIANSESSKIEIGFLRDEKAMTITAVSEFNEEAGKRMVGMGPTFEINPITGWYHGFMVGVDLLKQMGDALHALFTGEVAVSSMGGPIMIGQIAGDATKETVSTGGLVPILNIIGFLSINIGVINLLPLPALDGGKIVISIIEIIRRGKQIPIKIEAYIHLAGFIFLLSLMAIVTYFDLVRAGIFS